MPDERASANQRATEHAVVIEVGVPEVARLFNAMDPSPFRERDLDPKVEEFIVGWARDVPRHAPLTLVVHLDQRSGGSADDQAMVQDAMRKYFEHRAQDTHRRLRQLFRIGRTSLAIGIAFLAVTVGVGGVVEQALGARRLGAIVRESLLIGGWVAMWRPLEIFLYEWWPIRAEARLFERLAAMPVRVTLGPHPDPEETKNARKAEALRA